MKAVGFSVCPGDSHNKVKETTTYILTSTGMPSVTQR